MLIWILENFTTIMTVLLGVISTGSSIALMLTKNNKTKLVASTIQHAIKMIPSLITVSENVNGSGNGSTKEAFVMAFIENMFTARGVTMTDEIRAEIKENIANIVTVTKEIHTGAKEVKKNATENIGNDASGTSGLRVIS